MFLITRDEVEASCTEPRYETGLTAPAWTSDGTYEARAGAALADAASVVPGVGRVGVALTFDVPWNVDMMSEIAKVELGMF